MKKKTSKRDKDVKETLENGTMDKIETQYFTVNDSDNNDVAMEEVSSRENIILL